MGRPLHAPRLPFSVENKNERRPFKPKAWNHQDELKSLIGRRLELAIDESSRVAYGILKNADQFTVQIELPDQSTVTYFKSALRSYREAR